MIAFGRQVCGNLDAGAAHEWLVTDGLGGYAMGTVAGLRTRRYHGLLIVAAPGASARRLGLAALDPVVRIGERVVRLATDEWAGGAVDPAGHVHLATFRLDGGVPCWRWDLGDVVLQREIAMAHGSPRRWGAVPPTAQPAPGNAGADTAVHLARRARGTAGLG